MFNTKTYKSCHYVLWCLKYVCFHLGLYFAFNITGEAEVTNTGAADLHSPPKVEPVPRRERRAL